MDILYIGSKYDIGKIHFADGSAFSEAPHVVLYSTSSKKYYVADVTAGEDNSYDAVISAATSATMQPGVYALEIYTDIAMEEILKRDNEYVKAVKAAASPDSETDNSNS